MSNLMTRAVMLEQIEFAKVLLEDGAVCGAASSLRDVVKAMDNYIEVEMANFSSHRAAPNCTTEHGEFCGCEDHNHDYEDQEGDGEPEPEAVEGI